MELSESESILAFASEAEAVKWLLTAFHEQGRRIIQLEEENRSLRLRMDLAEDNAGIQASILKSLKTEKDLQPKQKDRSDVLLALLRDNQGKMFAKDARKKMGLKKATFSVLLKSLKDEIDKKPYHLNKRQLVISLR